MNLNFLYLFITVFLIESTLGAKKSKQKLTNHTTTTTSTILFNKTNVTASSSSSSITKHFDEPIKSKKNASFTNLPTKTKAKRQLCKKWKRKVLTFIFYFFLNFIYFI